MVLMARDVLPIAVCSFSDFLQPLNFVYSGNFAQTIDDLLQMFQVGDVEHDLNAGLAVGGMRGDVFYVALGVADHSGNVLQHAEAVVTENGELHGIRRRRALVAGPLDVNLAFGLIHQIRDVGAIDGVHRHALAARDVPDNSFAANRIAAAGAVDHHVSLAAHGDGVVIAEDAAHHAGNSAGLRSQAFGFDVAGNRRCR